MPWLIGTALLHSLAATEKRGVFKAWTTLLAIAAFSFSLLGTFLVRSGVLTSVHAFATDPVRGTYILVFLGLVVGSSLTLFAVRASTVSVTSWFGWLSREILFLINNLILAVVTVMVLIGTLQPILAELFQMGKISIGPPYFNLVFNILMAPLIFLVGLGPMVNWRQYSLSELLNRSKIALVIALLIAAVQVYFESQRKSLDLFQIFIGVFLAVWVIAMTFDDWLKRARRKSGFNLTKVSASHYGMYVAHIGLAIAVIGVVLSSHLSVEKVIRLGVGKEQQVDEYTFRFDRMEDVTASNYDAVRGYFSVLKDGKITILPLQKTGTNSSITTRKTPIPCIRAMDD